MIKHKETRTFPYNLQKMFALVSDVEAYPEYLPGWNHVAIKERKDNDLVVEQGIGYSQFNWIFLSKAMMNPHTHLQIISNEDPFRHLLIDWQLKDVNGNSTDVTFTMEMKMQSAIIQAVVKGVISQPIKQLLDVFEERAQQIYG